MTYSLCEQIIDTFNFSDIEEKKKFLNELKEVISDFEIQLMGIEGKRQLERDIADITKAEVNEEMEAKADLYRKYNYTSEEEKQENFCN